MSGTMRKGVVAAAAVVAGLSTGVVGSAMLNSAVAFADPVAGAEATSEAVEIGSVKVSGSFTYNGEDQLEKVEEKLVLNDTAGKAISGAVKDTDYELTIKKNGAEVQEIKDAGTYVLIVTPKDGSKILKGAPKESDPALVVAKKDAVVKANNVSVVKGDPDHELPAAPTAKVSGAVSGENLTSLYEVAYKTGYNINKVGTYDIIVTLKDDAIETSNYNLTAENGTLTVVDPEAPFIDTPSGTPHLDEIIWLYENKISVGWSTDAGLEFRGANQILRQDMAAFLYRLLNPNTPIDTYKVPENLKNNFIDVDESTPHYKEIMWCAEHEIVKGWDAGSNKREFRPTAAVIRQDMAAFLARAAEIDASGVSSFNTFEDVNSDTPHAKEIEKLAEGGDSAIIRGWKNEDGTKEFRGTQPVIRQDMAAFLYRVGTRA